MECIWKSINISLLISSWVAFSLLFLCGLYQKYEKKNCMNLSPCKIYVLIKKTCMANKVQRVE